MRVGRLLTLVVAASLPLACGSADGSDSSRCGDGVLDAGEACDDGNRASGDGCSASCRLENKGKVGFQIATNTCPGLRTLLVMPSAGPVGQAMKVSVEGEDPDEGHLSYDFTGSGGLIKHRHAARTATYTCGYEGTHQITAWIFDEDGCVSNYSATVECE